MNTSRPNVWLNEVHAVLPRVLALFDDNPVSRTRGLGDRYHWAWKLIDFPNGTYQSAVHGWARLMAADALPEFVSAAEMLRRIDLAVAGADRIRRPNGSCEEAFPYESSFCVTALVAYDLLSAADVLGDRAPKLWASVERTVAPMIHFLQRADETHGLISNHLATAVAALVRWHARTGDLRTQARARLFLDRILAHRSSEGWFREYEGADPGYQSLAMDYLADVHALRPDWDLAKPLDEGCRFLALAVQPDSSFGGPYGSRNTRFYAPGGLARLAVTSADAAAIDAAMQDAIAARKSMPLTAFDDSNLIPLFNSYVRAATAAAPMPPNPLPHALPVPQTWQLPEAGLIVAHRATCWTTVSTVRGGACVQIPRDGSRARVSGGVLARDRAGRAWGSQMAGAARSVRLDASANVLELEVGLVTVQQMLPTPAKFLLLRLLNVTIMRWRSMGEWIKRMLVRILVTGLQNPKTHARRRIVLDGPETGVTDTWLGEPGALALEPPQPYSAMHMASQGYWQRGDGL